MSTELFRPAVNEQACLKMGIFGFAGGGKTFTASKIAAGLLDDLRRLDKRRADKPVMFLDTENGSSFVLPLFTKMDAQVQVAKTRAFTDLVAAVQHAEKHGSILLIDSITHFWREFTETYQKRKNRSRLEFHDWAYLKAEWGRFSDAFVNSDLHIILCGRAGYEYDFSTETDSEGRERKELTKTGTKMKVEGEMGYEPSLLMEMERHEKDGRIWRTGTITKDRSNLLEGKTFENPGYEHIKPHVGCLAIGRVHVGYDNTRNSGAIIPMYEGKPEWQRRKEEKAVMLEEIKDLLSKHYPGQAAAEKEAKAAAVEKTFGTRTWARVEDMDYDVVKAGRDRLWLELEKKPYYITPPVAADLLPKATTALHDDDYLPGSAEAEAAASLQAQAPLAKPAEDTQGVLGDMASQGRAIREASSNPPQA